MVALSGNAGPTTHYGVRTDTAPRTGTLLRGSPGSSWPIRRAIVRARAAFANMRMDEASKATQHAARLLERDHALSPTYAVAVRTLQAALLAAGDHFAEARTVLLGAPQIGARNWVSTTILRYVDWKSLRRDHLCATDALDYLAPAVGGRTLYRIFGLCLSAAVEFDSLRPTVAAHLAADALALARDSYGNHSPMTVMPAILLAQVAYEQARFEEAEALLRPRVSAIRSCGFVEFVARAFVLLARLAVRRGRHRDALALLHEAENIARERRWARLQSTAASEHARTLQAIRENAERRSAPRFAPESPPDERLGGTASPEARNSRADMSTSTGAVLHFPSGLAHPGNGGTALETDVPLRYSGLETALRRAGITAADGRLEESHKILVPCLRMGAARGLCSVFVDVGPPLLGLLETLYHRPFTGDESVVELRPYIATLLRAATPRNAGAHIPPTFRPLSPREISILQMITRGMSNKRIAQSLGIAPETVKSHAKSIFTKLESRTRAQAVARAEAIGLL
jgi:DNA-binding CsgD family transcriptional regulator